MKKADKILLIVSIITLTIAAGHLMRKQQKVNYVNNECPTCGSVEVLDFGTNRDGEQRAHCYDCGQNFTIKDYE